MGIFAVWVSLASAQDGSGVSWHQGEEFAGFCAGMHPWLCGSWAVTWSISSGFRRVLPGVFQSSCCGEELAVAGGRDVSTMELQH